MFKLAVVTEKWPGGNAEVDPVRISSSGNSAFHAGVNASNADRAECDEEEDPLCCGVDGLFGWFDVRQQVLLITHSCLQLLL